MTRRLAAVVSAAVLGVLVAFRAIAGTAVVAVAAAAPLAAYAVAAVPLGAWALALVVACQVSGPRFSFAGFHFLPEHLVVLGAAGALLLASPRSLFRRPVAFEALLLAWIGWNVVVTLAFSVDRHSSLAVVGWMVLAWCILWVVRGWFGARPDEAGAAVRTATTIAAVLGAVTFLLWVAALAGLPSVRMQPEYVTGTIAAKGPALEANLFGSQCLCWLILLLRNRFEAKVALSPWLVSGLVLGIVSTMTRAAWIATMVVVASHLVIWRLQAAHHRRPGPARRRPVRTAAVIAMVGVILFTATGGVAVRKLGAAFDFGSSTGGARAANWRTAITDLDHADAYVTGLGTNSFGQRHESRTLEGQPDYLGNLPLSVLYETGLVGVVLFAGAMAAFVVRGRDALARLLTLAFLAALMIVGAATNPIWFGFVWVTVAVIDCGGGGRRRDVASDVGRLPAGAHPAA